MDFLLALAVNAAFEAFLALLVIIAPAPRVKPVSPPVAIERTVCAPEGYDALCDNAPNALIVPSCDPMECK